MTVDVLREYGLEDMDDSEIRDFLTNEGMGILGLPTEHAPYLLPISFGFDGESRLYFSFFVGGESKKVELSSQADWASFLVYSADSIFFWESVLLEGTLGRLPEDEWGEHGDALENAWHLDLFEKAKTAGELQIYVFEIEEQVGLKSMGLPPGMEREESSGDPE
ncbi:MAG: pyridoxamine 5'-phosphate oxidase family protein [Halovenus sp.]